MKLSDLQMSGNAYSIRLTPSLLAGFIASTSSAISGMPLFWDALAGLSGPIFDGGLVQSKAEAVEARRQRALAQPSRRACNWRETPLPRSR